MTDDDLAPFKDFKTNLLALPLALLFGCIVKSIWFFRTLAFLLSVIPVHEMGHALVAWFGGRVAVPLGAIVPSAALTLIGNDRHLFIIFLVVAAAALLLYYANQAGLWFLSGVCLLSIFATMYFGKMITNEELSVWISFAGIGGEFVLSTLLILAFYNPLFAKLRWDFFRFPFLLIGAVTFVNAFWMWNNIQKRIESIPFGMAISGDGASDTNGDMNKLINAGWTEAQIISSYLLLAKICLVVILVQYGISLIWSRRRSVV